jgi:hypothetical protein
MKAIRRQDWGDKEPVIECLAPIWFPIIGHQATSVERLQNVQNGAMWVITGSHKMADTDHLLIKTELLSVKDHLGLICKRFLASAFRDDHPSHNPSKFLLALGQVRRTLSTSIVHVHNLQSRYDHVMQPFLKDGVLPDYKKTIKQIHTTVVSECKRKLVNKVLGTASPDHDPSESSFPSISRTTLSQVRSRSKTYQYRIGTSPENVGPICRNAIHTTRYLFECQAAPINPNVHSLWNNPRGSADFLKSLPSFDHLPPNPPFPRTPPFPPQSRLLWLGLLLHATTPLLHHPTEKPWQTN